jgi:orotate phosphoribosyltransferase
MDEAHVLDVLQKVGAFRAGHFVFVSGLHADTYVNKNAMYPYTREMSTLCREIAQRFKGRGVEAVVGPATGGIILSQWVAYHLSELEGREVYSVYSDKDGDGFVIKRGYNELIKGKQVIVVEDLVTTGGSLRKVIEAARQEGAHVLAAVAICNRGNVTREMAGNPPEFMSMLTVELDQWPEAECDLCARGIPINTDVGHGKDFLQKRSTILS